MKFPAGLDIGATTPEEIAISVLAEIIKEKYKTVSKEEDTDNSIKNIHEKDPICGMIVDPKTAADSYSIDGKMYYFCCSGCKNKFQTQSLSDVS
ncbi:MAG: YHS domain-containing protein [Candidatus Neomarinimicrobiota bacterium]